MSVQGYVSALGRYFFYSGTSQRIRFGFLNEFNEDVLKQRTNDLMDAIQDAEIIQENSRKNKGVNVKTVVKPKRLTESEIENMTLKEKEEIMNKIIDNGVENMTEYDKKILPLLVK